MLIVGINAYHGDGSAAILRDGRLIAAVDEERFRRVKHWAGFPSEAIRTCLAMAGATAADVDVFAVSRNPRAHLWRKALFAVRRRPGTALIRSRPGRGSRAATGPDRKSTRLNSSHPVQSRMPSSA